MRTPPFSTTRRVRPGPLKSGYERASNGHTGDMHVSVLVDAGALGTTDCAGREGCTQISPCGVGPPPFPPVLTGHVSSLPPVLTGHVSSLPRGAKAGAGRPRAELDLRERRLVARGVIAKELACGGEGGAAAGVRGRAGRAAAAAGAALQRARSWGSVQACTPLRAGAACRAAPRAAHRCSPWRT